MTITVNIQQAKEMVIECITAGLVPLVSGSPGTGKSAILRQIAEEYSLKLIDLRLSQCDPTDLLGFPRIDEATGKADYAPMATFPLEGDKVPEGYDGWMILFDELTSCPPTVQAAAYKPLHEREIGTNKLHPKVVMVAAGNLETDNAVVEPMSTALQSRLVHMEMTIDHEKWIDWATSHGVDHRITSYVKFKPDVLYTFKPEHTDKTYASPRTWEFSSRLTKKHKTINHSLLPLLAGTISEGVAREFINFCGIYESLPTIEQVMVNPHGLNVPDEPSILFALTGSIAAHSKLDNMDRLMPFINRLGKEWQVVCLREVIRRTPEALSSPPVKQWISENSSELFE